jgi:nucleoside-diphosphate-sugar epimerase
MAKKALITGAGGFIGHHLLKFHKNKSERVRGVDIKYPEFEPTQVDEFELLDLRKFESCLIATTGGSFPQCVRPLGDLRGRTGEGPGCSMSQNRAAQGWRRN